MALPDGLWERGPTGTTNSIPAANWRQTLLAAIGPEWMDINMSGFPMGLVVQISCERAVEISNPNQNASRAYLVRRANDQTGATA